MPSETLRIQSFGPIHSAEVEFADLTVFVGPQASGKSLLLQLWKLIVDHSSICETMRKNGVEWSKNLPHFLEAYFGSGMRSLWSKQTEVEYRTKTLQLTNLVRRRKTPKKPSAFYIPAQRVATMPRGWPRHFGDYNAGDPFNVRDFSETLRLLMETELLSSDHVFPEKRRLKQGLRAAIQKTIFGGFELEVDKQRLQKELVLTRKQTSLPFMVWSAGQREFVPLLMGLYWLLPPRAVKKRDDYQWVILEEPEMGLHPRAIATILLMVLELMWRGYRVAISTHSPQVLELVWALQLLKSVPHGDGRLLELFDCDPSLPMKKVAAAALNKSMRVYAFDRLAGSVRDITTLDPDSEDREVAEWGGLSEFSTRANEIIARATSEGGSR